MKKTNLIIGTAMLLLITACTPTPPEEQWTNQALDKDTYPLETNAKITKFEHALLGFNCTEKDFLYNRFHQTITTPDQHGYIGLKGIRTINGTKHIMSYVTVIECQKVYEWHNEAKKLPKHSTTAYRLYFDPNNGYVYQQACYDTVMNNTCPKDENGTVITFDKGVEANPAYKTYMALEHTTQ